MVPLHISCFQIKLMGAWNAVCKDPFSQASSSAKSKVYTFSIIFLQNMHVNIIYSIWTVITRWYIFLVYNAYKYVTQILNKNTLLEGKD